MRPEASDGTVSTPSIPDYWANLYFKTNFNYSFYSKKYEILNIKNIPLKSSFKYESNGIIFI
jgi:hypothetical protein